MLTSPLLCLFWYDILPVPDVKTKIVKYVEIVKYVPSTPNYDMQHIMIFWYGKKYKGVV